MQIPSLQDLKECRSRADIATLLGFKPAALTYILFKIDPPKKYRIFTIPKKSGGTREISSPCPEIKQLQKRLSYILSDAYTHLYDLNNTKKSVSHGFRKKHSIITNAVMHQKRKNILNIDLEDFFPTINFGRVRSFFIKNKDFNLHPDVATTLTQIVCHENSLPQGAPTSPIISNFIARPLDIRLLSLAKSHGCFYTRYADDITFSTNKSEFHSDIAKRNSIGNDWTIGGKLSSTIEKSGFILNDKKTRVMYSISRQEVTGLIVNKKINTRIEYRKLARSYVHSLINTGQYYLTSHEVENNKKIKVKRIGSIKQLDGILNFIYHTERFSNLKLNEKKNKKTNQNISYSNSEKTYRKFLKHTLFCENEFPFIICEGPTDDIYLKSALLMKGENFPLLYSSQSRPKIKLKFFKHSEKMRHLLGMSGGTGDIKNFIASYNKEIASEFKERPKNPIIVVIDNDQGSDEIFAWIKRNIEPFKSRKDSNVKGDENFYIVKPSLYIVPIPRINESDTAIENLLPSHLINNQIDGKEVNLSNKAVETNQINKMKLADHVRKNKKDIDFSGFNKLLESISMAYYHYKDETASVEKSYSHGM